MKNEYVNIFQIKRYKRMLIRYGEIFGNKRKAYKRSRWLKWKDRIMKKVKTHCCCGFSLKNINQ